MDEGQCVRAVLWPLLITLGTLHERGVVHRDIKPGMCAYLLNTHIAFAPLFMPSHALSLKVEHASSAKPMTHFPMHILQRT